MADSKPFKIEVVHDQSGKVVKNFEYSSERERDKAYRGLLINLNMAEYTANVIGQVA